MPLPVVAIVGRPNVGKSSLLNALTGRRVSIVDPTAGVTRDRVSAPCEHNDRWFELVDTGGYGVQDKDNLTADIEQQIAFAVEAASLILFVVDVREELTPLDREVARFLKRHRARTLLVANKSDADAHEAASGDFLRLGFGEPLAVSALHGRGCRELKDEILRRLPVDDAKPVEPVMQLAIIGRRNVGKSTFTNAVAGQPRVIVSEVPGTTRDSIDVRFEKDGKTFVIIDTAGVRKKSRLDDIEFYAYTRATGAIRRADVVLLMFDATAKVSDVDKKIAAYAAEHFKPVILVINKWDLAKGRAEADDYGEYLTKTLPGQRIAPIAFTTASKNRNVDAVVDLAMSLFKQARTRVDTGPLNKALERIVREHPPPSAGPRPPRIYYASQVAVAPPTIVLFCNRAASQKTDYRRFMENRLSELLPYSEVPIRLLWRQRESRQPAGR